MPREYIDTGTDKRYVRRDSKGQFKESDDQPFAFGRPAQEGQGHLEEGRGRPRRSEAQVLKSAPARGPRPHRRRIITLGVRPPSSLHRRIG
jgi:hypothetical protein